MSHRTRKLVVYVMAFAAPFLAFHLELMTGRIVTPVLGGSSTIWLILLIVFQFLLLAGYLYVFLLRKLTLSKQRVVHGAFLILLLLASFFRLSYYGSFCGPLVVDANAGAASHVLSLLAWTAENLALPFIVLFSTGVLLISWNLHRSSWPHRLYSASNFGSVLGLVLYPAATEKLLGIARQSQFLGIGFIALCCAFLISVLKERPDTESRRSAPARCKHKRSILSISAFTAFMLTVTTGICCENIAPAPFLWMLPLMVYLLSFAAAFRSKMRRRLPVFVVLTLVSIAAFCMMHPGKIMLIPFLLLVNAAFFAVCVHMHGRLAEIAPEHDTSLYYLMIALGSATGTLAAVAFPIWINLSYQGELLIAAILLPLMMLQFNKTITARIVLMAFLFLLAIPWSCSYLGRLHRYQISTTRNLYGTLRVMRKELSDGNDVTVMISGGIEHGRQYGQGHLSREPTSYFTTNSGIYHAFQDLRATRGDQSLRVACIGLGVGTICAYGTDQDLFRFYEIDPAVVSAAYDPSLFTYLSQSRARVEVITGDARQQMRREVASGCEAVYDMLIVDAFSSGAIPTHLLTREAFRIYLTLIENDGVVALHITNIYIDLRRVVAALANHYGMRCDFVSDPGLGPGAKPSLWAILKRESAAGPVAPSTASPDLWTDDYIDLMSQIKKKHSQENSPE